MSSLITAILTTIIMIISLLLSVVLDNILIKFKVSLSIRFIICTLFMATCAFILTDILIILKDNINEFKSN